MHSISCVLDEILSPVLHSSWSFEIQICLEKKSAPMTNGVSDGGWPFSMDMLEQRIQVLCGLPHPIIAFRLFICCEEANWMLYCLLAMVHFFFFFLKAMNPFGFHFNLHIHVSFNRPHWQIWWMKWRREGCLPSKVRKLLLLLDTYFRFIFVVTFMEYVLLSLLILPFNIYKIGMFFLVYCLFFY